MVAVGLFAAQLGGRALWLVPLSFVAMMVVGGAFGMAGSACRLVEIGIGLSVVVLGLAVAGSVSPAGRGRDGAGRLFALFHGHAHGAEMPESLSGLEYAAGFVLATALLHAVGIAIGLMPRQCRRRRSAGARCRPPEARSRWPGSRSSPAIL